MFLDDELQRLKQYCQLLSVLYVEDENELNASVVRYLSKFFGHVETAYDGEEGLAHYNAGTFDIVMTDINMPKMNGIELAKKIKAIHQEQEIIIVSAYTETDYFMEAIHMGISSYIIKPIDYEQMNHVLYKLATAINMRKENRRLHENLYKLVEDQTKSIADNYDLAIKAMANLVDSRDTYTGGHSERVARYSFDIAKEMNLSDEECEIIFQAGLLHDIGKVTTPDAILLKPGKISKREYTLIMNHVVVGYELLVKIPMYKKLAEVVKSHHERFDGKGYPDGLSGDEIPLLSKIMIIADAFDAMTTDRIYKGRKSLEDAILEIQAYSGTQFDPEIIPFACKALSRVKIDDTITQLPKTSMESERFAYFFHDTVTDCYNSVYLTLYLQTIKDGDPYCAYVIFLKNFSQYNKKYGWEIGNALLKSVADDLAQRHPDGTLFRVQGDDFVVISKDMDCKDSIDIEQPSFLESTGVIIERHILTIGDNFLEEIKLLEQRD